MKIQHVTSVLDAACFHPARWLAFELFFPSGFLATGLSQGWHKGRGVGEWGGAGGGVIVTEPRLAFNYFNGCAPPPPIPALGEVIH